MLYIRLCGELHAGDGLYKLLRRNCCAVSIYMCFQPLEYRGKIALFRKGVHVYVLFHALKQHSVVYIRERITGEVAKKAYGPVPIGKNAFTVV